MHISKLNDYFKAEDEKDNLVIIPSGSVVPKPPEEEFDEVAQMNKLTEYKTSVALPYDNNIFKGRFSKMYWNKELSHSPKERAEMIYEAITAKNENGSYKYNNIYFTGGFNTEDVVWELDKLCREIGPLPERRDNLKTFGFSDATQLHHYLGQRGISTPVYYSNSVRRLIASLSQTGDNQSKFNLEPLNDIAKGMDHIKGYTQPADQSAVEDKVNQTKYFEDGYNFIIIEFDSKNLVKDFLETCKKFKDKKIVLLISKDTKDEALTYLLNNSNLPVFWGMPVGHGDCLENGEAIPLFANAMLEKVENGYCLSVDNKASDKVEDLRKQPLRPTIKAKGGNENVAIASYINGSAGVVFENLDNLRVGEENLSIKLSEKTIMGDNDIVQTMEMSIKKLYDKGVIIPKRIKQIDFTLEGFILDKKKEKDIEVRLEDLKKRYLPDLRNITLNGNDVLATQKSSILLKRLVRNSLRNS